MKIYINLTKLSSHTITPYLYNFTFTVAHFSSLTPPPLHLEKWCLSDHPRRNRYTRSVSHSRTTFCDFCYVSSFGQLKTGFGPPSQWSRFCWSELSKQNARNVGSRVTDGPCSNCHGHRVMERLADWELESHTTAGVRSPRHSGWICCWLSGAYSYCLQSFIQTLI